MSDVPEAVQEANPRPRRRGLRLFVVGVLMLLIAIAIGWALFPKGRSKLTFRGIGLGRQGPTKSASFSSGPIPVTRSKQLADHGVEVAYLGTQSSGSMTLITRQETRGYQIRITSTKNELARDELGYVLFDDEDHVFRTGAVELKGPVKAGDSADTIIEVELLGDEEAPVRVEVIRKE
jgi:hypothetical protein